MDTDRSATPTAGRGRPAIGPKVEVRLEPPLLATVDNLVPQGKQRPQVLRQLILTGLDVRHTNPSRLAADPDVEMIHDDLVDHCGIVVYSDGHRYWICCWETGELKGFTTDARIATAIRAAALLEYEEITLFDTTQGREDEEGYDPGQVAYPELVDAGRELLASLTQGQELTDQALHA